ncbi:MAG: ECF transporter S component [Oscillospiraceae bacterium]|nr:ECF transporter S component [Oscillospiraceae bacterium]
MSEKHMRDTGYMVRLAVLIAVILLLEFTGLGYIKVNILELTILQIPVLVGAIVLGPGAGAILGGVFGATSFFECLGKSAFGVALFAINPFYTFFVCMIPRILMGWLCGLIFRGLYRVDKTRILSYGIASLAGAVLNTVFFMASLMLLFGRSDFIQSLMKGMSVIPFVLGMVGVQGLVEAVVCFLAGTAISKALAVYTGQWMPKKI